MSGDEPTLETGAQEQGVPLSEKGKEILQELIACGEHLQSQLQRFPQLTLYMGNTELDTWHTSLLEQLGVSHGTMDTIRKYKKLEAELFAERERVVAEMQGE